jgi:polysaccharide lyase-like protein
MQPTAGNSSSAGTATVAGAGGGGGGTTTPGGTASGGSAGTAPVSGGAAGVGGNAGVGGSPVGGSAGAGVGGSGGASTSGALFTDGFEAAAIDKAKWTERINSSAMFTLDATQKHGGTQSLHLKHSGFSTYLAAEGAPIFPAPMNTFYARVWLRVAGPLPTGHVAWLEAGNVMNDQAEIRVGMNLGKFQSNLWPGDTDVRDPAAAIKADTWQCLQIKYGTDVLEVSLDGVKSSISTTTWVAANSADGSNNTPKTGWSPTYAAFRIGWELGDGEIWFDDVALDHSPIACQ